MGQNDPDSDEQSVDRRSVLKVLGTGAAGAAGLVAMGRADAADCWTETNCVSGGCQTHYSCRVHERTCCWDGGTVVCGSWEWNGDCCSGC